MDIIYYQSSMEEITFFTVTILCYVASDGSTLFAQACLFTGAWLFVSESLLTPPTTSFIESHMQVEFDTKLPSL